MARDLTQNPLFSFVPEAVIERQQQASRDAYSGSGFQSLGYGLGRLFGAGDEARAAEVKAAQDREDLIAASLKESPDDPYKAYLSAGKKLLDRGDTALAQQFLDTANQFKVHQQQMGMQQERLQMARDAFNIQKEKDRAYTIPEVSKRDIAISKGVLKQAGILGSLDAPGLGSDTTAEDSLAELIAMETNKILADQKYSKGPKVTQAKAAGMALENLKSKGIIKYNPSLFPTGDDWDFDVEAYNQYLGITDPSKPEKTRKPGETWSEGGYEYRVNPDTGETQRRKIK